MKKTISLVLAILMMVIALETPASAKVYSGTCGEHVTWSLDTNTGVLTLSGYGDMSDGQVEAKFKSTVKKVIIGDRITNIGEEAFSIYNDLTEVSIGKSVKKIESLAFWHCGKITSIIIPGNVKEIGTQAFYNCFSLNKITLEEGVNTLDQNVFLGCTCLESISIPNSIEKFYANGLETTQLYKNEKNWDIYNGYKVLYVDNCAVCSTIESETTSIDLKIKEETRIVLEVAHASEKVTCLTIPQNVYKVTADAIWLCPNLKSVKVYSKECLMPNQALDCNYDITYYGYINSTLFSYAKDYSLNFMCFEHDYRSSIQKATLEKNGQLKNVCRGCGKVQSKAIIYYPKTFNLSTKTYTYNGKAKTPKVTVFDSKGEQIPSSNYTVKYSNNKNVSVATAYVIFKGNYSGTKKLQFTIVPASTAIQKANSPLKTGIYVQWKKVGNITGYEVQVSASSSFASGKRNRLTKNYIKIKKLKSKKIYFVRVRTYKVVNGKPYYSLWSKTAKVKIK